MKGGGERTSGDVLRHQLIIVKAKILIQNSLDPISWHCPHCKWQAAKKAWCPTNAGAFLHPSKSALHPLPPYLRLCQTRKLECPPAPLSTYWMESFSFFKEQFIRCHVPDCAQPHSSLQLSFSDAYRLSQLRDIFLEAQGLLVHTSHPSL